MKPTGERSDDREVSHMRMDKTQAAMEPTGERSDDRLCKPDAPGTLLPQWSRPASGRMTAR